LGEIRSIEQGIAIVGCLGKQMNNFSFFFEFFNRKLNKGQILSSRERIAVIFSQNIKTNHFNNPF
jgi:hypothetical protein